MALTLEPPGHEATHWTVRAMAKAVGIAASSVVKIWHDHGLAPHRWRSFKLSNDKPVLSEVEGTFAEKLHDVVGLYVSPPAHAIVLSVDEKSQIQALDRTQPGLPLKRGRGATMRDDYKRNGTTTLFAVLTRRRLKNGVFHSVVDLQAAINRFIKEHNQQPRPFVRRAGPGDIIAAVRRGHQTLESIH